MATDQIKIERFPASFKNSHNGRPLGVEMTKVSGGPEDFLAFVYQCHLVEDNDGAPRCYGWNNPTNIFGGLSLYLQNDLHPFDRLGNATSPFQNWDAGTQDWFWAGLFAVTQAFAKLHNLPIDTRERLRAGRPDRIVPHDPQSGLPNKFPVVQDIGDPAPGYYVSKTGQAKDPTLPPWDPNRYWDASVVPYCVYANEWAGRATMVNLGDFGLAIRNATGTHSEFSFRDTGTNQNVGESSRKLCRTLVPTPDESAIYNEDFVSFLVFPGVRTSAGIRTQIAKLAKADNSDELALFLASGASLDNFKVLLRRLYKPDYKGADELRKKQLSVELTNLLKALSAWGYSTDGTLHLVERSINL